MNVHKNARLTPVGRALMIRRMEEEGWPVKRAAQACGVSARTAYEWLGRHRRGGERRLHDRSPAPPRCPRRTPEPRVCEIERLQRQRMTGPAIAQALGMARSTVGAVLRRLGLGRLANLDPKRAVIREVGSDRMAHDLPSTALVDLAVAAGFSQATVIAAPSNDA